MCKQSQQASSAQGNDVKFLVSDEMNLPTDEIKSKSVIKF